MDVIIDNVAGSGFSTMLKLLKRGGRLVSSGAIAGSIVHFDMRDMYLKDITLIGTTAWDEPVFPNLVRYYRAGRNSAGFSKNLSIIFNRESTKSVSYEKACGQICANALDREIT